MSFEGFNKNNPNIKKTLEKPQKEHNFGERFKKNGCFMKTDIILDN
jgi:hypothetical protein